MSLHPANSESEIHRVYLGSASLLKMILCCNFNKIHSAIKIPQNISSLLPMLCPGLYKYLDKNVTAKQALAVSTDRDTSVNQSILDICAADLDLLHTHISFIELLNSGRYSASGKWRPSRHGVRDVSSHSFSSLLPASFSHLP